METTKHFGKKVSENVGRNRETGKRRLGIVWEKGEIGYNYYQYHMYYNIII